MLLCDYFWSNVCTVIYKQELIFSCTKTLSMSQIMADHFGHELNKSTSSQVHKQNRPYMAKLITDPIARRRHSL